MRTLMASGALLAGILFAFLAPLGSAAPTVKPIQPGAALGAGTVAACSQSFVYRDSAGTWYGSTAAHCVTLNERLSNNEAGNVGFGTVVALDTTLDWAIFRVDADKTGWVSPSVRHWGGPTGVATAADAPLPSAVAVSAYPLGVGIDYPTGANQLNYVQGRLGVFAAFDGERIRYSAPEVFGDSGGAVLLHGDGKALGTTTGLQAWLNLPVSATMVGPSIQATIVGAGAHGISLTLQTAPFFPLGGA